MKKIILWILTNIGLYVGFVLGNLGLISAGFLSVVVFGYWFFSVAGFFWFSESITKEFYNNNKNWTRAVNKTLDGIFDTFVVVTMVYFGYIYLPIIYIIAHYGLNTFEDNYKATQRLDINKPNK